MKDEVSKKKKNQRTTEFKKQSLKNHVWFSNVTDEEAQWWDYVIR